MALADIRQQVIDKLESLSDEEMRALLRYIDSMRRTSLSEDYDAANDPAIGFFSADPELASRTEEILQSGFGRPKP